MKLHEFVECVSPEWTRGSVHTAEEVPSDSADSVIISPPSHMCRTEIRLYVDTTFVSKQNKKISPCTAKCFSENSIE